MKNFKFGKFKKTSKTHSCDVCGDQLISMGFGWFRHPAPKWRSSEYDFYSAGGNVNYYWLDECLGHGQSRKIE
jgi:hypothetical protein